jgi:DNA-binding response OmpR family regulator
MAEKRILLVEDEPQLAKLLGLALDIRLSSGHQVEILHLADEALIRLQHQRFDLVITDLSMPGMSGLDLIRHVRQVSPQTRTVLITAYGSPEVEEQARQLTAAYLFKPFDLREFVTTVQHILGDGRPEHGQAVAG